jgi:hypothetical protein
VRATLAPGAAATAALGLIGVRAAEVSRSGDGWQGAVAALSELLAGPRFRGRRVEVVLSNAFVRYALTPPLTSVLPTDEREALGRHVLAEIHGSAAPESWEVRASPTGFGGPLLVAAMDRDFLTEMGEAVRAAGSKLASVEPGLVCVLNRLPLRGFTGAVVVCEPGRGLIALFEAGHLRSIANRRADGSGIIGDLLAQETLRAGIALERCELLWAGEDAPPAALAGLRVRRIGSRPAHAGLAAAPFPWAYA